MSIPFYQTQVKVYPTAEQIAVGGIVCRNAQELWDKLIRDSYAFTPQKGGPQLGDFAKAPSIAELMEKKLAKKLIVKPHEPTVSLLDF